MRWTGIAGVVVTGVVVVGVVAALGPAAAGQGWVRSGTDQVVVQTPGSRVVVPPRQGQRALEILQGGGAQVGVEITDVDAKEKGEGASVISVVGDSPAEKAGIKQGDVIVEFDGERVRSAAQFQRLVRETPPGRTVKVVVMRSGKRTDLTVTPQASPAFSFDTGNLALDLAPLRGLQALDREKLRDLRELENQWRRDLDTGGFNFRVEPPPPRRVEPPLWFSGGRLGIGVQELTPQLADYFGTKDGVLVASVEDKSPADKAGLKAGDVITAIDGKPVRTENDIRRALASGGPDRDVSVGIVRDRKPLTINVRLEDTPVRRVPA
jgi:serine protease Do